MTGKLKLRELAAKAGVVLALSAALLASPASGFSGRGWIETAYAKTKVVRLSCDGESHLGKKREKALGNIIQSLTKAHPDFRATIKVHIVGGRAESVEIETESQISDIVRERLDERILHMFKRIRFFTEIEDSECSEVIIEYNPEPPFRGPVALA